MHKPKKGIDQDDCELDGSNSINTDPTDKLSFSVVANLPVDGEISEVEPMPRCEHDSMHSATNDPRNTILVVSENYELGLEMSALQADNKFEGMDDPLLSIVMDTEVIDAKVPGRQTALSSAEWD